MLRTFALILSQLKCFFRGQHIWGRLGLDAQTSGLFCLPFSTAKGTDIGRKTHDLHFPNQHHVGSLNTRAATEERFSYVYKEKHMDENGD